MSRELRISKDLALPLDAGTRAIALIGLRGSGKTFASAVLVEELHRAHVPVCIVDPVGAWWGLRSSADGKGPGLPIVIFGGDHADVPIEETAGELLANLVIDEQLSCVLDLSLLRKNARKRFMCDFAEHLYHRSRTSMHLVVDEAAMFAPQRTDKGGERLLGAMEDIVLRGRGRGLGITLITQRAALLNKSLLSQCEVLFAMRQSHNLDIKAIREWIDVQEQDADAQAGVVRSLPKMPTGEAFVWAPVLDVLSRVKVRRRETFDSSKTPEPGERRVEPRARAAVDLESIRARVAATVERAKAEDPRALKKRIAELEKQLAARPVTAAAPAAPAPVRIEVPIVDDETREMLTAIRREIEELSAEAQKIAGLEQRMRPVLIRLGQAIAGTPMPGAPAPMPKAVASRPRPAERAPSLPTGPGPLKLLVALAMFHPRPLTRSQLATISGHSARSSTFANKLSEANVAGMIEKRGGGIVLTQAGITTAGVVDAPPDAEALLALWVSKISKISGSAGRMLSVLAAQYPDGFAREALAHAVAASATSSSFANNLSTLNVNGVIEKRGGVIYASESLFLGAS